MDNRPICVPCSLAIGKVTRFNCIRNGFTTNYGHNGVLHGDLYGCNLCGAQIVVGFGGAADYGDHTGSVRNFVDPVMKDVTDSGGAKRVYFHLTDEAGNFIKNIRIPDTVEAQSYAIRVNSAYYCIPGNYSGEETHE